MPYFLTIQYPYNYLTISISDRTTIITTETISKFQAIGLLLPTLQNMLAAHQLTLADITCIGVNTGPGPFNTLRSIIATANGIAFAQHIPLVGCNGLDLLLKETNHQNTVAILDAFGSDVYYAIKTSDSIETLTGASDKSDFVKTSSGTQGYNSIEKVIEELNLFKHTIPCLFIGNGAIKHKEFIMQNFKGEAQFDDTIIFASTQTLINETYNRYGQNKIEREIFPLYFASPVVKS